MGRITRNEKPSEDEDEDDDVLEIEEDDDDAHISGSFEDTRDVVKKAFEKDLEDMDKMVEDNKRSLNAIKAKMQGVVKTLEEINTDTHSPVFAPANPSRHAVRKGLEEQQIAGAEEVVGTNTKPAPGLKKHLKDISKIERVAVLINNNELVKKHQSEICKLNQEKEGLGKVKEMEDLVEKYWEQAGKIEAQEPEIKKGQHKFINDRLVTWRRPTNEGKNFLHFLADADLDNKQPQGRLQTFMARVITKMTREMGATDSMKRTPLTAAIAKKNEVFVRAVCNSVSVDTKIFIGEALRSECVQHHEAENAVTCLHAALNRGESMSFELTKKIIEFAPGDMFTTTDIRGRTPLHLAVEYKYCSTDRADIVDALLARAPAALDHKTSDFHGACSVYQHHVRTRKEKELEDRKSLGGRKIGEYDGSLGLLANQGKTAGQRDKRDDVANMGAKRKSESPFLVTEHSESGLTKGREPAGVASTPVGGEKRTDLVQLNTQVGKHSVTTNSPVLGQMTKKSGPSGIEREQIRRDAAERIAQALKLAYFRNRKPQESFQFLHVQGQKDKELWFDFGPQPHSKTIRWTDFKKQFGHLEFDEVLQYAKFPRLLLDNESEMDHDPRYQGRRTMVSFFDWLKAKKVKRIVRVDVDDSEHPCHSDEAIEEALKPFQVEILNWSRPDMCPTTLTRIDGNSLREVHLRWGGSNAVLRAWGDTRGLCQIPTLKEIYIEHGQGLETKTRTRENLDRFEEDLLKSWPTEAKPTVFRPEIEGLRQPHSTASKEELMFLAKHERSTDPHKWMKCMTMFSEAFRQIDKVAERGPDDSLHPVTVAVIDDGTDITHPDLRGTNFNGKSFDPNRNGWHVSPYWHSTGNHGTLMARLIHQICPSATIHIIKLKTVATANSTKLQIDPKSAIQAIEYATEQGADVISMSWTTKPELEEDKAAFNAAITKANAKNVLMFCSASDQGQFHDCTFPHASNPSVTFCIGAAKATGDTADFVSRGKDVDYIFPGYEVALGQGYGKGSEKEFLENPPHTGSSVATALAAGLAALVVECVRLGVLYTNDRKNEDSDIVLRTEDLDKIRNKQGMEDAFRAIGVDSQTDGKYVKVWNKFSTEVTEKLKDNQGMRRDQLGVIFLLAVSLTERKY